MFNRGFEEHNEESERYLKIITSSNVICVFENDIRIREEKTIEEEKRTSCSPKGLLYILQEQQR